MLTPIEISSPIEKFELLRGVKIDDKIVREVYIRSITGYEEDVLASKNLSAMDKFDKLLISCVEQIGDIKDKDKIEDIIKTKLSTGDRVYLIICLRIVSLGSNFETIFKCPSCGKEKIMMIDLSQLKQNRVSDEDYYDIKEFDIMGNKFKVGVSTGETERIYLKNANIDIPSYNILSRVRTINDKVAQIDDIKRLPIRIRNVLRDIFDKYEGSVDLGVVFECDCGWSGSMEVDVSDRNFFFQRGI